MKKYIALISVSLTFVFAVALANTEDPNITHDSASDPAIINADTNQQAGSAGISADSNSQNAGSNMMGDTSQMNSEPPHSEAKMSKSCIDEKGTLHRAGQKGFRECQVEKVKHSEQMGGTAEGESETNTRSKEVYKTDPSSSNPSERTSS